MKRIRLPKLTRRVQMIAIAGVIVAGTSSVAAFNQFATSSAEETPVEVVIKDHDERITKNESDIAETKKRVDGVEQQAASNTETIHEVQKQVVVVEKKADNVAKQQVAQQAAQAPVEVVAPEPVKVINKQLIVAVRVNPNEFGRQCDYTLEHGRTFSEQSGIDCRSVGSIVEPGTMNTHKLWNN